MALTLCYHPLASFCWKVLAALYENDTPFTPRLVDLADPEQRDALLRLAPMGKFPVLHDAARDRVVTESSIIIEYLTLHHPGPVALLPVDPDRALEVRQHDRFFDLYVHEPMQQIVADRLRPADRRDPHGVDEAKAKLESAYAALERTLGPRTWAAGDAFTMADCAAGPALHYADRVHPISSRHPVVTTYLAHLMNRPSFVRVLAEAAPYAAMFPVTES